MTDISGTVLGRVWNPAEQGPSVVTAREGVVYDITSSQAPLVRDICEMEDPLAYVKAAEGAELCSLDALLANDPSNPEQPYLLAPCDLQAVKA
jgi:fumarylacetoacetate (FAA) hydrolase family protein